MRGNSTSEKKQTGADRNEDIFRHFITHMPYPVCFVNRQDKLEYINEKFTTTFGYTLKDVPNLEVWWEKACPDPEYRKWAVVNWNNAFQKSAETQTYTIPDVYRVTCRDGKVKHIKIVGVTYDNTLIVSFDDVSELMNARTERERLFVSTLTMLCTASMEGFFEDVNPAFEETLGWNKKELQSKPFVDFIHPDDVDKTQEFVANNLKKGKPAINFINRYQCKDGTYKTLNWMTVPYDGKLYASAVDMTEVLEKENEVVESNAKFKTFFENSVIGKSITGVDGSLMVNKAFADMLGYSIEEMLALNWKVITHPDDVAESNEVVSRILAGEMSMARFEKRFIHKNGEIVWADVSTTLQRDINGSSAYFITTVNNITNQKKAEIELSNANSAKDKLFSIIGHDMKNPLNSLIGFSSLLKEKYEHLPEQDKRQYIEILNSESEKAYNLLSSLLDWSRTQLKVIQPNKARFSICEGISSLVNRAEWRAKAKQIELVAKPRHDLYVMADRAMVETALRNIISNAIKFSKRGGKVNIQCNQDKTDVLVKIQDQGIGMKDDEVKALLDPNSYFSNRGTENESGTGLGIKIAREFIVLNGGSFQIESELNVGTTVTIVLPGISQ